MCSYQGCRKSLEATNLPASPSRGPFSKVTAQGSELFPGLHRAKLGAWRAQDSHSGAVDSLSLCVAYKRPASGDGYSGPYASALPFRTVTLLAVAPATARVAA